MILVPSNYLVYFHKKLLYAEVAQILKISPFKFRFDFRSMIGYKSISGNGR